MKDVFLQRAVKLNRKHKRQKWWKNMVRTMGVVVVFCTTYALILPAITMEKETICEKVAHLHEESCYVQQPVSAWNCALEEGSPVIHSHGELCFDVEGALICQLPQRVEHSHGADCYTQSQEPVCGYVHEHSAACATVQRILSCGLEERSGHNHSETCSSTQMELICTESGTVTETEAHIHDESCYQLVEIACTVETIPAHQHEDACYTEQEVFCDQPTAGEHIHVEGCYEKQLNCSLEECVAHRHAEVCYDAEWNLICQRPQVLVHTHTESCLVVTDQIQEKLICQLEEHSHEDACYPIEEESIEFICGFGVHDHVETCYDALGELVCSIPVHAHEAACILEEVDLTADVETEDDWKETFAAVPLTGNWPEDVLNLAKSQLDYQESAKNVILAGDQLKGYNRYGAWYGDSYADWNTLFAAFCLHYAAVEEFPVDTDAARWVELLTEDQLYKTPDLYTPKPGDLIFLDLDQIPDAQEPIEVIADRVGIVAELLAASEEEPARIKLIEGDQKGKVSYVTCELGDPVLAGYGEMPAGNFNVRTFEGADFTVTATYGREAELPQNVELVVQEILSGTDDYETYYRQSVEVLMGNSLTEEAEIEVSFARFFDIGFVSEGVEIEPAAPVNIQIHYSEDIPVTEEEQGTAVHFTDSGVEILSADTFQAEAAEEENGKLLRNMVELFTGKTEKVDTFQFTQDSFSVSGTLVITRAAAVTATPVEPTRIDNTRSKLYVLYTIIDGQYYALSGVESNNKLVPVTMNEGSIVLTMVNTNSLLWTFQDKPNDNGNYLYNRVENYGTGRFLHPFNNGENDKNITTVNAYDVQLVDIRDNSFKIRGANNNHIHFSSATAVAGLSDANQVTRFYAAEVGPVPVRTYNVWFDGTLGSMMSYYGAADENMRVPVAENGDTVMNLPETWASSTKYDYKLRGWYDIENHKYYRVDPDDGVDVPVTITGDTVFYADWIAATYDVGQDNADVVSSVDTSDFITTYVFDYNALFNVMSERHTGSISANSHSENWTIYNNGETVPYQNMKSLGFAFIDYDNDNDGNVEISYPSGMDRTNTNQGDVITVGIPQEIRNTSGKDLLDLLFNPATDAIGKYYVGTGNYLFQYMDSTTANYDGEHDGYYYLDARLNAASYNQSQQRFYLYDYLERTSDSKKDGGVGQYSDFLPFNSPYIFDADQLDPYVDSIMNSGYEYDAKEGGTNYPAYNSLDDANTNYFFGIRSDIDFFLPNDSGVQDEYGNYGNISTRGEHMIFDFHGDDDVWVFIDDELVLDIGGLHGIMFGQIDFSTGTVISGKDGATTTTKSFRELLGHNITEGTHTMTVYYMERGSSQSNCAIYFNIAPRYDLEITKEDIVTADKLNGAKFSIFNDEAMADPAELWNSFEEYESHAAPTNTFTVVDGVAKCWGISAGKTYYIYETTPPPGYPANDDMIRITLNNRGTATIETTTLHGTEGFAVIKQDVNDTLKIVALTVTNQQEGETTEVRVEKTWDESTTNLPQYITVYLMANGERIGRSARLTESNGWSYTWTGLPKYHQTEGIDQEIEYVVEEVFVPNFITVQGASQKVVKYVDWVRVDQMSDSKTFLLIHNDRALTYDGSFGWMDQTAAEADSSRSAQWTVTTDHDGFHLKNGLGYSLTYGANGFYGTDRDAVELNQVFYYLNSRLMVHDHDVYYQFGNNGAVVREDGLAFQLYQKETLTGLLTNIVNRPVDEEQQTFVEVNKVWGDGAEKHANHSIVIHLYANGKNTGRYVTLNAANNWHASFDDLPYYQDGTTTAIVYTVVEEELYNYLPSYSEGEILQGRPVSFWKHVEDLTAGNEAYRLYANGYSLTVAADHDVTTIPNDQEDINQQWKVVSRGKDLLLQNVRTERYLRVNGSDLTTTDTQREASAVTMKDGRVTVGGYYLELGPNYADITASASNIDKDTFHVTKWVTSTGMNGTGYTVTNLASIYELPQTGGMGTNSLYAFGSLLAMAAALVYINKFGRKRQRGGRYSR